MTASLKIVGETLHDPEEHFWTVRPRHAAIRQQANARRVSPWAVLGGVLARVTAATPPQVQLPPIVGGFGSLNLFVGVVGRSGQGKGASQAAASSLLNTLGGAAFGELTVGTGEGLSAAYVERIKDDDGNAVIHQHAESALFDVAEVDTLGALAGRTGATLLSELRKVWSGERLGFQNRDTARTLPVDSHAYRASLVVGVQPNRAGAVLNDADGGTPQRFVWMSATDPSAPAVPPAPPGTIDWIMPGESVIPTLDGRRILQVCETAWNTIDHASLARLRGEGDALDGHALLSRLKVAAALTLLDERGNVEDEDWQLAGIVMAESDRVRRSCQDALAAVAKNANTARAEARAEAAVIAADHTEIAALARAKERIVSKLGTEWVGASELRSGVTVKLRGYFEVATAELVSSGQVEVQNDMYQGRKRTRYRLIPASVLTKPSALPVTPVLPRNHAEVGPDETAVTESSGLTESVSPVPPEIDYCVHGVTLGKRCSKCGGTARKDVAA